MSRGFDGFEIDDFRDSDFRWGRAPERDRSSDWNSRLAFTTSTGKKNAPINSTAKVRNARTESARR